MLEGPQWLDEMKAPNFAALAMVESMGFMVVRVAIEHNDAALFLSRHRFDFFDQSGRNAAVAEVGMNDEVIDLHVVAAPQFRTVPQTRETDEFSVDVSTEHAVVRKLAQNFFVATLQSFVTHGRIEKRQQRDDVGHRIEGEQLQFHDRGFVAFREIKGGRSRFGIGISSIRQPCSVAT